MLRGSDGIEVPVIQLPPTEYAKTWAVKKLFCCESTGVVAASLLPVCGFNTSGFRGGEWGRERKIPLQPCISGQLYGKEGFIPANLLRLLQHGRKYSS